MQRRFGATFSAPRGIACRQSDAVACLKNFPGTRDLGVPPFGAPPEACPHDCRELCHPRSAEFAREGQTRPTEQNIIEVDHEFAGYEACNLLNAEVRQRLERGVAECEQGLNELGCSSAISSQENVNPLW